MVTRRRRRKKGKPRGTTGRKPTGLRPGELLSEYPKLTFRLPPDDREQLAMMAKREGRPEWRVLVDAIRAYCAPRLTGEPAGG